ncbi:hypothetical protein BGX27_005324, partial [Mortierella sp. AM989]
VDAFHTAIDRAIELTEDRRVSNGPQERSFTEYLYKVGEGLEPTLSKGIHNDYIGAPDKSILRPAGDAEVELVKHIYLSITLGRFDPEFLKDRAVLTALNEDIDKLNRISTSMLQQGRLTIFKSQDSLDDQESSLARTWLVEYLNALNPAGLSPS